MISRKCQTKICVYEPSYPDIEHITLQPTLEGFENNDILHLILDE